LEQQFDRHQSLKTAVADKPPFELTAKPFGRDRFGASYWLFTVNIHSTFHCIELDNSFI
jgi:hypothetical protein